MIPNVVDNKGRERLIQLSLQPKTLNSAYILRLDMITDVVGQ